MEIFLVEQMFPSFFTSFSFFSKNLRKVGYFGYSFLTRLIARCTLLTTVFRLHHNTIVTKALDWLRIAIEKVAETVRDFRLTGSGRILDKQYWPKSLLRWFRNCNGTEGWGGKPGNYPRHNFSLAPFFTSHFFLLD